MTHQSLPKICLHSVYYLVLKIKQCSKFTLLMQYPINSNLLVCAKELCLHFKFLWTLDVRYFSLCGKSFYAQNEFNSHFCFMIVLETHRNSLKTYITLIENDTTLQWSSSHTFYYPWKWCKAWGCTRRNCNLILF